jgi:general secretion pathway protein G
MLKNQKGFTFVELLIVVAIIGIISAMAVPNLIHGLQRAKISRTKADLRTIAIALEMYRLDYGFVPFKSLIVPIDDIPELTRYFKGATVDSWGEFLYYYSDGGGTHYVVASKGTDRNWDGLSGPPNWETPQNFKGFKCKEITLDNADELIERGCDIKYIDGGPLY